VRVGFAGDGGGRRIGARASRSKENAASVNRRVGTLIAGDNRLGIRGPSLRQGAAGTPYFEPGGVSF
jgi:hypothetical protein